MIDGSQVPRASVADILVSGGVVLNELDALAASIAEARQAGVVGAEQVVLDSLCYLLRERSAALLPVVDASAQLSLDTIVTTGQAALEAPEAPPERDERELLFINYLQAQEGRRLAPSELGKLLPRHLQRASRMAMTSQILASLATDPSLNLRREGAGAGRRVWLEPPLPAPVGTTSDAAFDKEGTPDFLAQG